MSTTTVSIAKTTELRLRHGGGFSVRQVSTAPPRECTAEEIPVIDLEHIDGDRVQREAIAEKVREAAETSGFFYIKNHGIKESVIKKAHDQALTFFEQPDALKERASKFLSKSPSSFNGWSARKTTLSNPGEGLDTKESFGWSYSPEYDPLYQGQVLTPKMKERSADEEHLWDGTAHLTDFKQDTLAYWSACLTLARKLNRIFAIALALPEDYFDKVTTFPGADGVYNFYPASAMDRSTVSRPPEPGLGSHTDLQCFTLLWQDQHGGLQILNSASEWIWATPVDGTLVVNIGDFMGMLTNDRFRSTVHRAFNRGVVHENRISMPFFFGFNYDEQCSVLPSCVDSEHPAKYKPISCGQWRAMRFQNSLKDAMETVKMAQG